MADESNGGDKPEIELALVDGVPSEVLEPETQTVIALFDPLKQQYELLKKEVETTVFDLSIPKERKAAGSLRARITALRTEAKKIYERWNKPRLTAAAKAREFVESWEKNVSLIEDPFAKLIEDFDAAEKTRIAKEQAEKEVRDTAIKARIASIDKLAIDNLNSASVDVEKVIVTLENAAITAEVFHDFVKQADDARNRSIAGLKIILAGAKKREEQQAALDAQRKADEEKRAKDAADAAERKRELDERDAQIKRNAEALAETQRKANEETAAQLERDRQSLVEAGQKQTTMLTEQVDSLAAEKQTMIAEVQDRHAELDARETKLSEQEQAVADALRSVQMAKDSTPEEVPDTTEAQTGQSSVVDPQLDIEAELGDANAEASAGRSDMAASTVEIEATATPTPAPAPTPARASSTFGARGSSTFGYVARRTGAAAPVSTPAPAPVSTPTPPPGSPIQRPDDLTLLQMIASTYNQPSAAVLTWLEEIDMFALRRIVGPEEGGE